VISVVTITRAALTHSAPELRRELLFELVSNEGIRVFPLEEDDEVEPPPNNALMPDIEKLVKAKLGEDTRFSAQRQRRVRLLGQLQDRRRPDTG
jgi:two-component system osmolarity sensor histidine kinase EnvZ